MNKNKEKIIKSGVFLVATALILIVATVAWFISGNEEAKVNPINADIVSSGFGYLLYEAKDVNKNGVLDAAEAGNWIPVSEMNINISSIVPNEYHFYKAIIQSGSKTSLQFKFSGISVTLADPAATNADVLSRINVRFSTLNDGAPGVSMTGGNSVNSNMLTILGDPPLENVIIYDLDLSTYQNRTFTIYYDVGIYQATVPTEKIQGSMVNITKIEFI